MHRGVGPGEPYLNGAVTPVHLIIYQLDAVLHALWGQELSLAHHSWMERGDRTVRVSVRQELVPAQLVGFTHGPWQLGQQCPCPGFESGTRAVWVSAPPSLPWVVQGPWGVVAQYLQGWKPLFQPQAPSLPHVAS